MSGFKQRERKRRAKVARTSAARKARTTGSSCRLRWLTLVKEDTCCARCAGMLRIGREMVYRHTPREALCLPCADADPAVSYRPSAAWESKRGRRAA